LFKKKQKNQEVQSVETKDLSVKEKTPIKEKVKTGFYVTSAGVLGIAGLVAGAVVLPLVLGAGILNKFKKSTDLEEE